MSLHYSDPSREPRECPLAVSGPNGAPFHPRLCMCRGTGRLGDPEARPDVAIYREGDVFAAYTTGASGAIATGPTEAAALEAARKALREAAR